MPRRTTPHLSQALAEYLTIRGAHLAPTTMSNDRAVLRRFVAGVGDPQTHNLSAQAVETWFAEQAGTQMASSYNKVLTRVRGLTRFCQRRGWLEVDPVLEVRTRRVHRRERLRLSAAQIRELIERTENPRDRAMLATAANTGMRASDLVALRVGDLDLAGGLIRFTAQKTGETDALPITSDLMVELRRWLTWYAQRLAVRGQVLEPDFRAFPALGYNNVRVGRHIELYGDPQVHRPLAHPARVVHRALVRIGITATAQEGYHTLRRSVGRLVFEQAAAEGHDGALRVTAALLGHRNVATTEGYIGVSADRVKRDQLLLGRSFLGPSDPESSEGTVVALHATRTTTG